MRLKKIEEQVMVITGASSGIGLTTARMAARKGARLALTARSGRALDQLRQELESRGCEVLVEPGDVADPRHLRDFAEYTAGRFGRIDTWVNNAGVSMYGRIEECSLRDMHRLVDTTFWGVVYGSLAAVPFLRRNGGALINIGSVVSDRAIPLQGIYSAAKHAVKGFTDALRMELEEEEAPISVTLIKPAAIDTPYTKHAGNYLEDEPSVPPPVYAPETVARAILHAAQHQVRDINVGAAAKMFGLAERWAPRFTDKMMERSVFAMQHSGRPRRGAGSRGLDQPSQELEERGDYEGHVMRTSTFTEASLHPVLTGAALLGLGALTAATMQRIRNAERPRSRKLPRASQLPTHSRLAGTEQVSSELRANEPHSGLDRTH